MDGKNGWQIGEGFESASVEKQDAHDLASLYEVIFNKIVPTYYENTGKWEEMMRESVRSTCDDFAMKRMLENYYNKLYTP